MKKQLIDCVRKNNDVNGNPRFVCHFLSLITEEERDKLWAKDHAGEIKSAISAMYELALQKSRCIGGKKFHNKQFGGGIIFQVYSEDELQKLIDEITTGKRLWK